MTTTTEAPTSTTTPSTTTTTVTSTTTTTTTTTTVLPTPAPTPAPTTDPKCRDDTFFEDSNGYFCKEWGAAAGFPCEATDYGYPPHEALEILDKCPVACGQCEGATEPEKLVVEPKGRPPRKKGTPEPSTTTTTTTTSTTTAKDAEWEKLGKEYNATEDGLAVPEKFNMTSEGPTAAPAT